jgi:hypothetical protein
MQARLLGKIRKSIRGIEEFSRIVGGKASNGGTKSSLPPNLRYSGLTIVVTPRPAGPN